MQEETIIDEKNFEKYFKEINNSKPEKDDILASYRAKAYLIKGELKKEIINYIKENNIKSATELLIKSAHCIYEDAIKISKTIQKELLNGDTEEKILNKEYEYTFEMFYYTKEENVPKNDKHWVVVKIVG